MNARVHQTDEQLVEAIQRQDEEALRLIYEAHYPMVHYFVTSNSGTESEAKDVYQEAVIVLYENAQQPGFVLTCKIKTYLYSVCRRLWLKRLAEKSRYVGKIEDFESFIPFAKDDAETEDRDAQFRVMKESLAQLGEPCRTILEDFFIHGRTMQQITDKMGYTNADNAKNQKYKCLMRLKKLFFSAYNR